jgi:hypothetical protein
MRLPFCSSPSPVFVDTGPVWEGYRPAFDGPLGSSRVTMRAVMRAAEAVYDGLVGSLPDTRLLIAVVAAVVFGA